MIEDGKLDGFVAERYAGWDGKEGKAILAGKGRWTTSPHMC